MRKDVSISVHGPSVHHQVQSVKGLSVGRAEPVVRTQTPEARVTAGDTVSLSAEAEAALANARTGESGSARTAEAERGAGIYTARGHNPPAQESGKPESVSDEQPATPVEDPTELTEHQKEEVQELKARDAEVRRNEQAHAARGGSYATSPQYKYKTGPDGRRYIVDGSVWIDVAKVEGDVKATLRKMETVIGAATSPANPSAQDRSVASAARALAQEARAELSSQAVEREDIRGTGASDVTEATEAPPVEESEEYGAATSPLRPRLKPPGDILRAYQANAPPVE